MALEARYSRRRQGSSHAFCCNCVATCAITPRRTKLARLLYMQAGSQQHAYRVTRPEDSDSGAESDLLQVGSAATTPTTIPFMNAALPRTWEASRSHATSLQAQSAPPSPRRRAGAERSQLPSTHAPARTDDEHHEADEVFYGGGRRLLHDYPDSTYDAVRVVGFSPRN
jgi:hypothetical protein